MKNSIDIDKLKHKVSEFRDKRDWKQFHTPKNLAMALSVEVAELSELFLWTDSKDSFERAKDKNNEVKEEIADVFIYLLSLADVLDIDLQQAVIDKINKNEEKYPVSKSKGSSKKYNEL